MSTSNDYDAIFAGIETAKPITNFAKRLGAGRHRVAITRYNVKESQKGLGKIIELDVKILQSTTEPVGETRGWAWFPSSGGQSGQYEQARAQEFIQAVKDSLGDPNPIRAIGGALASAEQHGRGLVLDVEIQIPCNADGSPKLTKQGKSIANAFWHPVDQNLEAIAKMRAELDAAAPPTATTQSAQRAAAPAVTQPVPQVVATPAPTQTTGLGGGFSGYKKS